MMQQPTLTTPCGDRNCLHKLGVHYKRFDGQTGCAGMNGQREEFPCGCSGFMVRFEPNIHTYDDPRDRTYDQTDR